MRCSPSSLRTLVLLPLIGLATAACGDGTGPRLTAEEVSGAYNVCSLVFTPEDALLPAVDLRVNAFENNAGVLAFDAVRQAQLQYRAKGQTLLTVQPATYTLGQQTVTVTFDQPTQVNQALLLPPQMTLDYQRAPQQLSLSSVTLYQVRKVDYERITGRSFPSVIAQFRGSLSGTFSAGSCS